MVAKRLFPVLAVLVVTASTLYFYVRHAAPPREPAKVHRVTLSWNPIVRASSYNVYRRNYRDGEFVLLGKAEATKFEDAAATGQERYCYQIAAVDAKAREGARSKEFCVTVPYP